jgi:hypothetical protein
MMPTRKWGIALGTLMFSAGAALATENITCSSSDGKASVSFLVGTTPGLNPLALTLEANGKYWVTKPDAKATTILIAQAFSDDEGMKIDITDDNAERIIAKLRVTRGHDEGSEPVTAGTLMIVGEGAWPVICEGE